MNGLAATFLVGLGVVFCGGCTEEAEHGSPIDQVPQEPASRFEVGTERLGKILLEEVEITEIQREAVTKSLEQNDQLVEAGGRPRFAVFFSADGTISIHKIQFSEEQIAAVAVVMKRYFPNVVLSIRSKRDTPTDVIKRVVRICADAGINDAIL